MNVFTTPDEMRRWSTEQRSSGRTIAVVPTMGALHDGHIALIAEAGRQADLVIVTIFVNPLQFNETSDFDAYPRPIDDDVNRSFGAGAHAVYAPTAAAMYPPRFQNHVEPGVLADRLEGPMRPGHFRGVATVVAKLFGATTPHFAVFGQKDYQQLAIIRQMSTDLDLGVQVIGLPTVREPSGLAMSSRNMRLDDADRSAAAVIRRSIKTAADAFSAGEHKTSVLRAMATDIIEAEPRATLEYVDLVDAYTLEDIQRVESDAVMLAAVWFGGIRLIDNEVFTAG